MKADKASFSNCQMLLLQ